MSKLNTSSEYTDTDFADVKAWKKGVKVEQIFIERNCCRLYYQRCWRKQYKTIRLTKNKEIPP